MVRGSLPQVFCKIVFQVFFKILKIHKKAPVVESLFKSSCRPSVFNKIKKEIPAEVLYCEFCEIFKRFFFIENLQITASMMIYDNSIVGAI